MVIAAALVTTKAAAQVVSYNYDGVYQGVTRVSPGLSDATCRDLPLTRIEIRNGALRAWQGSWQTVKGLVTHDGFFNADYYFPGRAGVVFEGTIDGGGRLTGGIFDGGCAWVVEMVISR
jgi:hypothetical protein